MATASKMRRAQTTTSTPERVAALRELAERDALSAQDAAWAWFERLGKLAEQDRGDAAERLAELFACGQASAGIDGPTDGILVAPLIHPIPDRILRYLAATRMPWLGKRFNVLEARGDNLLTNGARWPIKLIWPLYSTHRGDRARVAFDFETRVEAGGVEPSVDVLVIDYAPIDRNPRLVIRSIRDELVEIVDGAHLGRILWRQGEDRYTNIGYFALRTPAA
jgi:hypothetical protein